MAVEPKDLGISETNYGRTKRFFGNSSVAQLKAAVTGTPLLPIMTPLTFQSASQDYDVWEDGEQLDAFLVSGNDGENGHQSSATGETLIVVSLGQFEVHYDDLELPTNASQTQGALLTAVQALNARRTGIHVRNVPGGSV